MSNWVKTRTASAMLFSGPGPRAVNERIIAKSLIECSLATKVSRLRAADGYMKVGGH